MNYIYGISITLPAERIQDLSMGLVTTAGKSYLKFSESEITGISDYYYYGRILSISDISYNSRFEYVGGLSKQSGFNIVLSNHDNFTQFLHTQSIELMGCPVDIYEFSGTDADSDSSEILKRGNGIISAVSYDSNEIILDASLPENRRNANMYNNTPITFGTSDPASGRFFRLDEYENISETFNTGMADFNGLPLDLGISYPTDMSLFPLTAAGGYPTMSLTIRTGEDDGGSHASDVSALVGTYLLCKEAATSVGNIGQYRKITSATRSIASGSVMLTVGIEYPYEDRLDGQFDGEHANQHWFQIVKLLHTYIADSVENEGFPGGVPEVYVESDGGMSVLPDSFTYNTPRVLVLRPNYFTNSLNDIRSFSIIPAMVERYTGPLATWDTTTEPWWHLYDQDNPVPGVYIYSSTGGISVSVVDSPYPASNIIDGDASTYWRYQLNVTETVGECFYYKVFKIQPPKVAADFSFRGAYIGLKLWSECSHAIISDPGTRVKRRRYIAGKEDILTSSEIYFGESSYGGAMIYNLPNFYIPDTVNLNNEYFWNTKNDGTMLSGYKLIDLKVTNSADYNSIEEVAIFLYRQAFSTFTDDTKIYECAIMFDTDLNIGSKVYV